ncbi:MAG TPA: hypothetical protein VF462_13305 [Micromonosporaceae bacterium]
MTALADRLRALTAMAGRATAVPLLVRCGIVLAALTALAVAFPPAVFVGPSFGLLAVVALAPAIAPGRAAPTVAVLVAVAGWLLSTTGYGERAALWRLLALATALYLLHSLCALACALPFDAEIGPEVVAGWLLRALGVLLGSAVLVIFLLGLAGGSLPLPAGAALFTGLAVAVAAAALLGWLLRRR